MVCSILVSMQTLAADVQGLRKGLDLTKSERDKQPDNFIIFVSFCYSLKQLVTRSFSSVTQFSIMYFSLGGIILSTISKLRNIYVNSVR